jgi:hypothetical protein
MFVWWFDPCGGMVAAFIGRLHAPFRFTIGQA